MAKSKAVKIPISVDRKVRKLQREMKAEFKRKHNMSVSVPFTKAMDAYFTAMETKRRVAVAKGGKVIYVYP